MYINTISTNLINRNHKLDTSDKTSTYQTRNIILQNNNLSNKSLYIPKPLNNICFCGVKEIYENIKDVGEKILQTPKKRFDEISKLFSDKEPEISENEISFLQSYEEKEQAIKEKYSKKIAAIHDGFRDRFVDSSEKKRETLRQQCKKELQVAYEFQDAFEKREQDLIELKKQYRDLAKELNFSKEILVAFEKSQATSISRKEIAQRKKTLLEQSGFSKLAGYSKEKAKLQEIFIDKIDGEKSGEFKEIPNAILFYGPTGCGKTTFANALAQEADCNYKIVSCRGTQKIKENKLIETLYGYNDTDSLGNEVEVAGLFDNAQQDFLKTNKRTIILIDEFDRFFSKDVSPKFIREMKNLMENCSKTNHVTLFLTTNDPQKIPYELLNSHRTGLIVNLDPPDKENSIAVIDYYLKDIDNKLNYNQITEKLFKYAPSEVYSNVHLKSICDIAIDEMKPYDKQIDTDMFLKAIDKYNKSSDNADLLRITKHYLDQYEDDKNRIGA